jgi:flagellum-specific peptidoglycan hydrolase FlgJ
MKYSKSNPPLVCMQTQSTCYKGTVTITPKGVLWHSTGVNNPTLKRYVQPSDVKPKEDTYSKEEWLKKLGKNTNNNDWNHIKRDAGLNAWIGKLADGTVAAIQTMPWNYKPWGCGTAYNGGPSCNNGWMQFEICEGDLSDKNYFDAVYKEACELTAYYCSLYGLDPKGTVSYKGKNVPVILCHQDSYKLGLGSNHSDIYHWFKKHGKTMDDVRNDVAKLMSTPTVVKTYEVYVDIPTYPSADNAKAKTNSKITYAPGTYYIYNKYPNGVNGMLNITRDSTGNSAGGWINPAENITPKKEEPESVVQKLYRIRTTWADSKSQKGAFSSLENAKDCCQKAGAGYNVFDWNGKLVYSYIAPKQEEEKKPETTAPIVKAVYDLDFPVKTKIVDKTRDNADDEVVKAIKAILANNSSFDIEIAKTFFTLAPKYGIDPMRVISQSILETGWFKYSGSAVVPEHHNYCGLGVTVSGKPGNIFDTIENGVRAQLQHLYAYGCKDALPAGETTIIDPRFKYVTRGIAPYWEQLAGRWAVPGFDGSDAEASMKAGTTYGQKIDKIYKDLMATAITDEDVKKYINAIDEPKEEPKVEPVQPDEPKVEPVKPNDDKKEIDTDRVNSILALLEKLISIIINLFKNK